MYKLSDFNYNLPPDLIAQKPAQPRDHARLLLLERSSGRLKHDFFYNFPDQLQAGDILVVNNSKVFPARLSARKAVSGGKLEVFLHKKIRNKVWECLIGGRAQEGLEIDFAGSKSLRAVLLSSNHDGTWQVAFNIGGRAFNDLLEKIGSTPLPPYIKRDKKISSDRLAYQTIYARDKKSGSVAAPTAGLHFTKSLLRKIKARGVEIVEITLQVGLGTFSPVKEELIENHKMHSEMVEIKKAALKKIITAKQSGRRVIAVGTTSCRTLESWGRSVDIKKIASQDIKDDFLMSTDIFIYPPFEFKIIDGLLTNFHLPQSSLLMLVSAFAGKKAIDKAYRQAIEKKYRFFSYGDAMFIS